MLSGIGGQSANRIRNRQVIGSSPIVGSIFFQGLTYTSHCTVTSVTVGRLQAYSKLDIGRCG